MKAKEKLQREGWDLERLVDNACELRKVTKKDLLKRNRCNNASEARALIAYWGHSKLGLKGSELAKHFGISRQAISKAFKRGEKLSAENNYKLTPSPICLLYA